MIVPGAGDLAWRSSRRPRPTRRRWASRCGRLAQEDPSFRVRTDEESGQTIISGMGELHLEIIVDRMKREFSVEANVGKPQVAYRETIRKAVAGRRQVRQAVRRQGPVRPRVAQDASRSERGQGLRVRRTRSTAARFRREYIPAVEKGMQRRRSPTACWPASRSSTSRCTLVAVPTTTSTRPKWRSRSPASMAFKEGLRKAQPGAARADDEGRGRDARGLHGRRDGRPVSRRRGMLQGMDDTPSGKVDQARGAAGEMFGYATTMRSLTPGPRDVHDGIRPLRRGAEQHRRSRSSRRQLTIANCRSCRKTDSSSYQKVEAMAKG